MQFNLFEHSDGFQSFKLDESINNDQIQNTKSFDIESTQNQRNRAGTKKSSQKLIPA